MTERTPVPDTADHDALMSWLQDRELKDNRLADARSRIGGNAIISSTIGRLQAKAYAAFPHIDRAAIDALVHLYVDPQGRVAARPVAEPQS